jgi:hypothetical protein
MKLTIPGVDFAWGAVDAKAIKDAGFKFGIAYLSYDRTGKNWSQSELKDFADHGLGVGFVWETASGRALSGHAAGQKDASEAKLQAAALGYPNAPICFAVDFDVTPSQKAAVAAYFRGAMAILGKERVGIYGSYYALDYLARYAPVGFYWQTYAWSGGYVHPQACVLQYSNSHFIKGLSCDFNHAAPEAFTLFLRGPHTAKEKRPPLPLPTKRNHVERKAAVWRHHLHEVQDVRRIVGAVPALTLAAKKLRQLVVR